MSIVTYGGMRTTVRLSEPLMVEVKGDAARHGQTFTSVLEDALQRLLNEEKSPSAVGRADVIVFGGTLGVRVDIADRAAVQRVLDEDDATKPGMSNHASS